MVETDKENAGLDETGIIEVTISEAEEIEADHADLSVIIRGTSLFTGQAALTKAREVAQLVAALQAVGIQKTDIRLQGVHADSSSGVLGKTSSATYSLKIRCTRLEMLAETLGAITSQKNTDLQRIFWGYDDDKARRLQWLDACITRANAKAARIAAGLGAKIIGIARFTENYEDPEAKAAFSYFSSAVESSMGRSKAGVVSAEDLGMKVSHTKIVKLTVNVAYRVAKFGITSQA
jgi:uncharacterized protein YggE